MTAGNPDNPGLLVHLTGRPPETPDRAHANLTPEGRLIAIVGEGRLQARSVFGTYGPVVCFSELTENAMNVQFTTGFTWHGPYPPWGLVFNIDPMITRGVRPVWYMSKQQIEETSQMSKEYRDMRVRYDPGPGDGRSDWLHEREWRVSVPSDETQCVWPDFPISNAEVMAVIVGRSGWNPPKLHPGLKDVRRLLWNGTGLMVDGSLEPRGWAANES